MKLNCLNLQVVWTAIKTSPPPKTGENASYEPLVGDIEATGVKADITPFEVCALGNVPEHSRKLSDTWSEEKLLETHSNRLPKIQFLLPSFSSIGDM